MPSRHRECAGSVAAAGWNCRGPTLMVPWCVWATASLSVPPTTGGRRTAMLGRIRHDLWRRILHGDKISWVGNEITAMKTGPDFWERSARQTGLTIRGLSDFRGQHDASQPGTNTLNQSY